MAKIKFRKHLFICTGKSCSDTGAPEEAKAFFKEKIKQAGLREEIRACKTSCLSYCKQSPNMLTYPSGEVISGQGSKLDWEKIWDELVKE